MHEYTMLSARPSPRFHFLISWGWNGGGSGNETSRKLTSTQGSLEREHGTHYLPNLVSSDIYYREVSCVFSYYISIEQLYCAFTNNCQFLSTVPLNVCIIFYYSQCNWNWMSETSHTAQILLRTMRKRSGQNGYTFFSPCTELNWTELILST